MLLCLLPIVTDLKKFQSPRSGKFESNLYPPRRERLSDTSYRFNPLDRGNLNQMRRGYRKFINIGSTRFNPLDRGNLNQIA